jgi:uncharacterized protein
MTAVFSEVVEEGSLVAMEDSTSRTPLEASDPTRSSEPLSGRAYRELLNASLGWLDKHHEIVNALNVFPVPDGDTGTNMLLTMRSACQEIVEEHTSTVAGVARAAAHGALMGARGNSGVILSQILRGLARGFDDQTLLTGSLFASALAEGARVAYKGVNKPVEGTILTVVREAAAAGEQAARVNGEMISVLDHIVAAADEAVQNTPKLLPVLAQAGKVDSGGKGLYYILQGMLLALRGEEVTLAPSAGALAQARPSKGEREIPALHYGFDVQFLAEGPRLDVDTIRTRITALGDCPLVEGDEHLVKVHVHVPDPGQVLSYAVSLGFVTDVVVENMDDMVLPEMPTGFDPVPPRFVLPAANEPAPALGAEVAPVLSSDGPGIVAVVPGAGLTQVFRSLGAQSVVTGGQTMNPSTQELLQAVAALPNAEVVILPNNGNVVMTALQAKELADKPVAVVQSKSVPQGIAALLALNPHADLAQNLQAMATALQSVQTGEVTTAVQDAQFDGITVHAGDTIGLLNDKLTATGPTSSAVVLRLLEQMGAGDLEILTLYFGQPETSEAAETLRAQLRQVYPDQEIEVVDGGQPFYHYIISAE